MPAVGDNRLLITGVRAEMARAGVSQRALAERIGVGRAVMHRRFSGQVEFRTGELQAIADALGVPVSRFFEHASVPEQRREPGPAASAPRRASA